MKSFYVLALLSLVPNLALADTYDDRVRMNEERANAATIQKLQKQYAQTKANELRNIMAFGRAHSGYAETPSCQDLSGDLDSRSIWIRVRQECGSGICVNVRGEGDGMVPARYANDPMAYDVYARDAMISSCKVVLRNGLACAISLEVDRNAYGGDCLDANGHTVHLSVPAKF
ncbi:MAG: hypothetical protein ACXVB9_12420 [Bdellovibrionota bacterium]